MSLIGTAANHLRVQKLALRLINFQKSPPTGELCFKTAFLFSHPPRFQHSASIPTAATEQTDAVSGLDLTNHRGGLPVSADSADVAGSVCDHSNVPKTLRARKWNWWSRRTGLVGIKLGMTQMWNKEGFPVAVTVLQVCVCVNCCMRVCVCVCVCA